MASEKLTLDLEFAILEQNADLVNALFQELKIEGDSEGKTCLLRGFLDFSISTCLKFSPNQLIYITYCFDVFVLFFRNINFDCSAEGFSYLFMSW